MTKFAEQKLEIIYINKQAVYANVMIDLIKDTNINYLYGPTNLKWEKKVEDSELQILSLNTLKEINKADKFLIENGYQIIYQENLDPDYFLKWLDLYQTNLDQKENGNIYIDETFIANSVAQGGIFIKDPEGEIIGGIILTIKKTYISCDYRAHKYLKIKGSSISALLELYIERFAKKLGKLKIRRGTDRNLYGIILNTGLRDFKIRYGFKPHSMDNSHTYFKRGLVFFKPFEKVVTYIYKDSESSELVLKELTSEELKKYTYSTDEFFKLINQKHKEQDNLI